MPTPAPRSSRSTATVPVARRQHLVPMVLWGPPDRGKTTTARLLADAAGLVFAPLPATFAGVADVRQVFRDAGKRRPRGWSSLLFVAEIHRANRPRQHGFLPHVEDGTVVLAGATTENPSCELNGAFLSPSQVFVLEHLDGQTLTARTEELTGPDTGGRRGPAVRRPRRSHTPHHGKAKSQAGRYLNRPQRWPPSGFEPGT
ncbi:AAA family ATPase [Streptomyces sp. NPDC004539]|uniref:AAA family ATPase n=1 Tax=Streptomyces sp. NPDC004539 TaxID=3154280 RepID=UPI0033ACC1F5